METTVILLLTSVSFGGEKVCLGEKREGPVIRIGALTVP